MRTASNIHKPSKDERLDRRLWYYFALGLVSGASVIAFAVLPQPIAGFTTLAVLVMLGLIDFLARRFSAAPLSARLRRGKGTIVYIVALCVVLGGAYVLDWAVVRRGGALWLAWTMAGLVLVVVASGAWFVEGHSFHKTAAAT